MSSVAQAPATTWIQRHRLICYFALTYAISWPLWLLSRLAGGTLGTVLLVIGAFGPPLAAAVTIRYSGGSLREWLRSIVRCQVPVGFYAYALGLPALIMAVMNAVLVAVGQQPDISVLVGRLPAYIQTLLITAVIFGGQEEPGWRGFALPALQQRHSPLVATLILGLGWVYGTFRSTVQPDSSCLSCSPSSTAGCTTGRRASCCASCYTPASPLRKIICC
jgi:uncharacterized protein